MAVLSGLEPKNVFFYFEEICKIPHGSGNTEKISAYLCDFAKSHGLTYEQDELGNVLIKKPGTNTEEIAPPVILQGHMDMVCEKEADCDIDFTEDGLTLLLNDGIITAEGTTLGGDDGIAVAYMLAILAADDISHPPIEAVFTVDEEIGMLGAAAFDMSKLEGRLLLNIDSEDEGVLLSSCAGGITAEAVLPVEKEQAKGYPVKLSVEGATGGHSGVEIIKQRANAASLLGRILYTLFETVSFRIVDLSGGTKDNAIPRSAVAELLIDSEGDLKELVERTDDIAHTLKHEYEETDPKLDLRLEIADKPKTKLVMTYQSSAHATAALFTLPCGVMRMSEEIPGLVQTSLNLGILTSDVKEVSYSFSVRSSVGSEKEALVAKLRCMIEQLGGSLNTSGDYPAWEYKRDSVLRDLMYRVFSEQYGRAPKIEAIHAGVECGFFAGGIEGLDAISFGPDMKDIHTTKESMDVASVARTWDFLTAVLAELA